ncbi:uncharacterized protein LOC131162273 [Malania oleifera]|uniref:uncharacterized protein LOC131162273 n=1 Tax=Malania oleifera TaxID=397392 RepID=UPI0025AEB131|nr:uncharacterized protein LOC131162273 [Malania oleifera]
MGASSSSEQTSTEQREIETEAASTGALPLLQKAFSKLADPDTKTIPPSSLQKCFSLTFKNSICEAPVIHKHFLGLLDHLGPSIVELYFVAEKGGFSWIEFVRGYIGCCGRMSGSRSLNNWLRVFATVTAKAGLPSKLQFESSEEDCKINGSLMPIELLMLLQMCWIMMWDSRVLKFSKVQATLDLPDINHLVLSAIVSCAEVSSNLNVWDCDTTGMEVELPAGKIHLWVLKTVPRLADCFMQFVHSRLQYFSTSEDGLDSSSISLGDISSTKMCQTHLLTPGRAWAVFLTQRSTISEEILRACFHSDGDGTDENLLYRSSLHGKGFNRFWSNIEGYSGSLLLLISASSVNTLEDNGNERKWIIGALTQQSFENRDIFYGSSGNLYALGPVFNAFLPTGREKNFVYSHLHSTGRVYEPRPKLVGVAFGGTAGNERIFLDEDFARVTVRHHAVDKTYGPGSLFPNQGFLPAEALVSEVEVWGLSGRTAKEVQSAYKRREQLFTEQRRKVDLKTFASWDDSPEKMMMDIVSDPNRCQREDR